MNTPATVRRVLERLTGPTLSVIIHIMIVAALMSVVAFTPKPEETSIEATYDDVSTLTLDTPPASPLNPPPPEATSPADMDAPMDASSYAIEPTDVALDVPTDAGIQVDTTALSPLSINVDVGRDQPTLTALKQSYGDRAARNGLYGSYYNRIDFTGETFTRIDETLNKQWELDSPWPGKVRAECFSVLWTGRIVPKRSGTYTLYLQSDDGARLWINGQLVLDQYVERQRAVNEVKLEMLAGLSYDIKYAFCDVFQHAISKLEWSADEVGIPRELIPTDCLWADGPSTAEVMKWNEARAVSGKPSYANRSRMKNPAEIAGFPLSQLVNYTTMSEDELNRLQVPDLIPQYNRLAKNGKLPGISVQPVKDITPLHAEQKSPAGDDVKVEIL